MTDGKHTPGPWHVSEELGYGGSIYVRAPQEFRIAEVLDGPHPSFPDVPCDGKANARLIAAAPTMLEALREMVAADMSDRFALVERFERALPQARAALAKATNGDV